ncbi:TldD/PmbA family protein [Candidatus Micrarchaeota archaeon]|nr:TldD/PmbA family protein [Candidatus Micrarchaeota archaeon]
MLLQEDGCARVFKSEKLGEAEIYSSFANSLSVEYAGGTYKSKEFSSDSGYGIRVLNGGRVGFSHANLEKDVGKCAKTAKSLSRFSPKTGFSFEPAHASYPKAETFDSKAAELEPELAFSAIEEILQEIKGHAEPTRVSIGFMEGMERVSNTSGVEAESRHSYVSVYAEAKKGTGLGFSIYSSCFLPDDFGKLGEEAGKIAAAMDKSAPLKSGNFRVKFSHQALSSLLGFMLFHFDGDNRRRGISTLKSGEKKFCESFTLISDPLAKADAACPFDGEGAPSAPIDLVREGRVGGFLYDRYTAALEGVEAGGCCQRSDYSSLPRAGITNLVIPAGEIPESEFPQDYLEVVSFHGIHTSDPVSGDFGVDVDIAFLHKEGKRKIPVSNMLLSGNVFNLFKRIEAIGKEQHTHGGLVSPEIWFSGVHLIGK